MSLMQPLSQQPPHSPVEPIADVLHGIETVDPYRWLEEQYSPRTRKWISEQTIYARKYFDSFPDRERVRSRVEELLTVDNVEVPKKVGHRYFFRKRAAKQEQPCIYMRSQDLTDDVLLVDPSTLGLDPYTSVDISQISSDGRFLLYQIKRGGERSGEFEILDVDRLERLPDSLPRGFLRGLTFSPDQNGFYYVHEIIGAKRPYYRAAYYHALGTPFDADEEIFYAGEAPDLKLAMGGDNRLLCFAKTLVGQNAPTEYYSYDLQSREPARLILRDERHIFGLAFWQGRIFAISDEAAPNRQIVELVASAAGAVVRCPVVPEHSLRIKSFAISEGHFLVHYLEKMNPRIRIFDLEGLMLHEAVFSKDGSIDIQLAGSTTDEIFYRHESFKSPPAIFRYLPQTGMHELIAETKVPVDTSDVISVCVSYRSHDGTQVPMHLVGRGTVAPDVPRPTILTGYGGFGVSISPRFGIFTSFLIERGFLFALAGLRGGSEFGTEWHAAARGRKRQKAFDDFISAAEWLVANGYTTPGNLAIFGGSNSGLLVGAALTQRPELFRAVVCLGPLLDMLRYHLFDFARKYRDEYGTAENPEDFAALLAYSPYHRVKDGVAYPAVLLITGDADTNCNPMHARKMAAKLQAASTSGYPIFLDYKALRGHIPVLPLSERIEGLTDRLSFVCEQLGIAA